MPTIKRNQEIETKLRVRDTRALLLRLKELRAREIIPRTYESNTLYDTAAGKLRRQGQLIRIRLEQQAVNSGKNRPARSGDTILAYKGPVGRLRGAPSIPGKRKSGGARFKIRDEVEVIIADGEQMSEILRALELGPVFRYEKFRTTYALPGISGLKVEFDETPIGLFLELEGEAAAIDRAAELLGYSRQEYIAETYGSLYIADCRRAGRKPSNMVFSAKKVR